MDKIKLNTGIEIPVVGSGTNTFGKVDNDYVEAINGDTTELESAITAGYRHFDTAIAYRNEAVVGQAINASGLARSEFFITSKIPGSTECMDTPADVKTAVDSSLNELNTPYIDLYLVHHPVTDLKRLMAAWHVLEAYVDKGLLHAIGVSNFNAEQLSYVIENARIKPAVNQIQSHPGMWNADIVNFCVENNVVPEAWGPLSGVTEEAREALALIGERYTKSWAQVALRYQIERGVVVIPKSTKKLRQEANIDIFDFKLTAEERDAISRL